MKKTYCKNCNTLQQENSKFCVKCGSNEIEVKKDKTILIGGLTLCGLAIILAICMVVYSNINKPQTTTTSVQDKQISNNKQEVKEILSTDYVMFSNDYNSMTDLQKDDYYKKVKGELVQWTGKVENVDQNYICIKCLDSTLTYDVQCYVADNEKSKLIDIQKDQQITIEGKISGQGGTVLPWSVNDCKIK